MLRNAAGPGNCDSGRDDYDPCPDMGLSVHALFGQAAPQKAWSGKSENVAAAQRAFAHRAAMNGLAARGQWKQEMERKAA